MSGLLRSTLVLQGVLCKSTQVFSFPSPTPMDHDPLHTSLIALTWSSAIPWAWWCTMSKHCGGMHIAFDIDSFLFHVGNQGC